MLCNMILFVKIWMGKVMHNIQKCIQYMYVYIRPTCSCILLCILPRLPSYSSGLVV